jgi:putative DNA primase/helicase
MNTEAKTAVAFAAAAQSTPADSVAAVGAVAADQSPCCDARPLDLTTIDEMVFAIDQDAANEADTSSQPPMATAAQLPDYSPSDVGNAERFSELWGEVTRYDVGRGSWMLWSGTHWEPDAKGDARNRMVKVAKQILNVDAEVHRLASKEPDDWDAIQMRKLKKEGQRLHTVSALEAGLRLASCRPELATLTSQFDMNPMEFNCQSGVIDLCTGALLPHSPRQLNTHIAPVALAPAGAECRRWLQFVDEIMCGDNELVSYLQRVVGYALTGRMDEQCFFVFYGCGSNGKSTFINTIRDLMGSYAKQVEVATFMDTGRNDGLRNDLAALAGRRLVVSPEGRQGAALDESTVKAFTGGDALSVRFLHKEFFELQPVGKIVLATNHKPVVRGTDNGIWRRMRLVPFLASFDASQADKGLAFKLRAELPAILRWAVEGAQLWHKHGLGIPQAVQKATLEYRSAMDMLQTFFDECCESAHDAKEGSQALYDAYTAWCASVGIRFPQKQASFNQQLEERGFVRKKTSAQNVWMGVRLKSSVPRIASSSEGNELNFGF